MLVGLCLLCAFISLTAHKPDLDDAFYANLAVAAADHPNAALLAGDTLHGVEGVPLPLPVYRVHALELLAGAVAYATPLRALDVAHLLIPTLAALLVPLAYARLFRLLIPGQWLLGVALAVGFLVGVGDASHGYGSFAFVRMQQGKAILLSLGLPLIAAYALEYAAAPTRARWLRLALAQIAAVGVSASALWAAPAVAGLALASARPLRAGWLRNLALGLAASAYPLLLALVLRAETSATFAAAGTVRESSVMFEEAIRVVIGRNPIGYVTLFCVLGAWALAATALARRFAVVFTLAFLLVFWSPLTAGWIAAHITSPLTYWRVFWLLPVPALVGLALAGPLAAGGSRRSVRVGRLAIAGLAAILFLWLPARHPASSTSGVRLAPPGWKIAPAALAAARAVRDHAPEGAPVLAPPWRAVTTLHWPNEATT